MRLSNYSVLTVTFSDKIKKERERVGLVGAGGVRRTLFFNQASNIRSVCRDEKGERCTANTSSRDIMSD